MIKVVIFDLDGTLINSLEDLADSSNYALKQLGYPIHSTEAYKYFIGDGIKKLMERILPIENVNDEEIEKLLKIQSSYYAKHCCDKTKPYEGINELLYELKRENCKLAVISNKPHIRAEEIVSGFFGNEIFNCVMGKMDGYNPKPDPRLTIEVIKKLKAKPEECLFVGDSGTDMLTASGANVLSVGVTWGFRTPKELLENGAKYLIKSPMEILDIVRF